MNGTNGKCGIKTNVDKFSVKKKKGHIIITYFSEEKQVAQVNFPVKPFGLELLQALQAAIWRDNAGAVKVVEAEQ